MYGKSHALDLPHYQPGRHQPPDRKYFAEISNEQVLFLINRNIGLAPYVHDFVQSKLDPQILSGFVCAMTSFMGEVSGSPSNTWKTVYNQDSTLLVEGGSWCVGVISVSRETSEVRSKLRRVVQEFEDSFKHMKDSNEITGKLFMEFDNFVRRVFIDDRLSEHSILLKGDDWFEYCKGYTLPSTRFKITNLLYNAQNGQSLGEIARQQEYAMDEVKNLISEAIWKEAILVEYTPSPKEILAATEGALTTLYDIAQPINMSNEALRVIGSLDSRKKLLDIFTTQNVSDRSNVCAELGILLNKGYLQRISTEHKLVLLQECVLTKLLEAVSEYSNKTYLISKVGDAIVKGIKRYPWLSRIRLSDNLTVKVEFEVGMGPKDLDYVYNSLKYLVNCVYELMKERFNPTEISSITESIENDCNTRWLPSLWEVML
ncbi:MAG: hypothetical protein E4H14_08045 [Candidatus Thorarchaeota archaeon]|nr:MAG: hypothetical protein E4H14_08045 [Candidatus Thorarchaeota archaeon]